MEQLGWTGLIALRRASVTLCIVLALTCSFGARAGSQNGVALSDANAKKLCDLAGALALASKQAEQIATMHTAQVGTWGTENSVALEDEVALALNSVTGGDKEALKRNRTVAEATETLRRMREARRSAAALAAQATRLSARTAQFAHSIADFVRTFAHFWKTGSYGCIGAARSGQATDPHTAWRAEDSNLGRCYAVMNGPNALKAEGDPDIQTKVEDVDADNLLLTSHESTSKCTITVVGDETAGILGNAKTANWGHVFEQTGHSTTAGSVTLKWKETYQDLTMTKPQEPKQLLKQLGNELKDLKRLQKRYEETCMTQQTGVREKVDACHWHAHGGTAKQLASLLADAADQAAGRTSAEANTTHNTGRARTAKDTTTTTSRAAQDRTCEGEGNTRDADGHCTATPQTRPDKRDLTTPNHAQTRTTRKARWAAAAMVLPLAHTH
ncbi:hypothetical protein ERJ75_000172000 [Trypanosoma vivax]|nr:hypothetical protein ERJ75_000172000 [Trypanosoma vivax]